MADAPTPTITQDLRRLEEIVRLLERDDTDLDVALGLFEEGVRRLHSARTLLSEAELKVQRVLGEAEGELRLADLDE